MLTNENIYTAQTAEEVYTIVASLKEKGANIHSVFLDVDGTLIQEEGCAVPNFMDNVKKELKNDSRYPTVVGTWRSERTSMLVDKKWPEVTRRLQTTFDFDVFALTKMETGPLGPLPSVQEWRRDELIAKGFEFSQLENMDLAPGTLNGPLCIEGIIMTGNDSKSGTLEKLYGRCAFKGGIALIDDREEHIDDVRIFCAKYMLPFFGIVFEGTKRLPLINDPEIGLLQKERLINQLRWYPYDALKRTIFS